MAPHQVGRARALLNRVRHAHWPHCLKLPALCLPKLISRIGGSAQPSPQPAFSRGGTCSRIRGAGRARQERWGQRLLAFVIQRTPPPDTRRIRTPSSPPPRQRGAPPPRAPDAPSQAHSCRRPSLRARRHRRLRSAGSLRARARLVAHATSWHPPYGRLFISATRHDVMLSRQEGCGQARPPLSPPVCLFTHQMVAVVQHCWQWRPALEACTLQFMDKPP